MPKGFNIFANLKVKGPNLQPIIAKIKADLKGINVNVNINIRQESLSNLNRANTLLGTLNKNLKQVVPSANAATNAIRQLGKAISNSQGDARKFATDMSTISKSIEKINRPIKNASNEVSTFGELLGVTTKKLLAWGLVSGSIVGLAVHMKEGFSSAIRFQREMVKITQVGGDTGRTLKSLENEITKISTTLGVSSEGLVKVAVTLRQAGLSATETKKALDVLAKTELAPTFDNIEQTTEGVIAIMSQFKTKADDLNKVMSQLNTVSAQYAVESGDIIDAVKRAGGAFKAAGGNFQEFMALFTSVRATTRETAESIATGMRTIFARFERPATLKSLKELGIILTNKQGEFVGPFEAIKRISDALANLPSSSIKFAKIMEQLGGTRQLSKIIPLIKEFSIAQEALNLAKSNTNSLDRDAATAQEALLVKLTKLKEQFQELFRIILNDSVFKKLIDLSLNLATGFVKVTKALSPLLPLLTALMAVKLGSMARSTFSNFGTGFNKGAKLTFASGGHVPGNGSGDTIPAMLTPGEFVINKKTAQKIGYNSLNRINKYAGGGEVQRGKGIGVETLRGLLMLYGLPGIDPSGYARRVHLVNNKYTPPPSTMVAAGTYHRGSATIVSQREPFTLLHELGHAIDYKVGSQATKNSLMSSTATTLYNSMHPFKDVARVYHNMTKRHFKNDPWLSMSSYDPMNIPKESFANAFAYYAINKGVSRGISNAESHSRHKYGLVSKTPEFSHFTGLLDDVLPLIEKHSRTQLPFTFHPMIGNREALFNTLSNIRKQQKSPRTELQFAGGGIVPGKGNTDSISAMLTPGEFVVNKRTAQSIGYNNLNAVNHYANGGTVEGSPMSRFFSEIPQYPQDVQFVRMRDLLNNALKAGGSQSQHEVSEEIIHAIRTQLAQRGMFGGQLDQGLLKELRSNPTMMVDKSGGIIGSRNFIDQDRTKARRIGKENTDALDKLTTLYKEEIRVRTEDLPRIMKYHAGDRANNLAKKMAARAMVENGGSFTDISSMPSLGGSSFMKALNSRFHGQGRLARGVRRLGRNARGIALTGAFLAPFVGESVLGTAEHPGFAGTGGAGLAQIGGAAVSGGAIGFQVGGPGGAAVGAIIAATGALINFRDQLEQIKADKINKQFADAISSLGTKNYNGRTLNAALGPIGEDFAQTNTRFSSSYTTRAGQITGGIFNGLKRRLSFGLLGESRDVYRTRVKNENQAEFSDKYRPAFDALIGRIKELSELNSGKSFQELMAKFPDLEKAMLTLGTVDAQQAKSVIKLINAQARLAQISAKADSSLSELMTTFDNMKTIVELTTNSFEKGMRRHGVSTGAFFEGRVSAGTEGLNLNALGPNGGLLKQFTQSGGLLTQIKASLTRELSNPEVTPENILAGKTDIIQNLSKHPAFSGVIGNALLGHVEQNLNAPEHMGMISELRSGHRSIDSVVKTLLGNLPEELKNAAKTMEGELSKISQGFQGNLVEHFGRVQRLSEEQGDVQQFGIEQNRISALNQIRRQATPFFHNGQFLNQAEEEANANVFFAGQSARATQSRLAGLGGVTGHGAFSAKFLDASLAMKMGELNQLQTQHAANPNDRSVMQQIALTTSQIGNLRAALKNLATSTTELDAAQHRLQVALEKEAADRQAREHVGESIAFGTSGSRQQMLMSEMLTQHVARNGMGAFMMLNDQQRQMVGEHLANTAGMPIAPDMNGMTRGQMRQGIVNFFSPSSMRNPNEIAGLQANVMNQQQKMNAAAQLNLAQEEQQIAKSFIDSASLFDSALKRLTSSLEEVIQSIQGKARGGLIYAAGGKFVPRGTDTVPAMLTPGEFVVNKAATAKNFPLLKRINSGVMYRDYGGPVDNLSDSEKERLLSKQTDIRSVAYRERQREIQKRQSRRQQLGLPEYVPLSRRQPIQMTNAFNDVGANEMHYHAQVRRRNNEQREFAARFQNVGPAGGLLQQSPQVAQKSNQAMQNNAIAMNQFNTHSKPLVEALNSFPREISIRREGTIQVVLNGAEVMAKVKGDLEKDVWGKIIETIQSEVKKSLRTAPL